MKRKSFINKTFLIGAFVMVFGQSCTNLDEEIYSQVTQGNFFKTREDFLAALSAAYTRLYGYGGAGHIFSLQEITSDELVVPTRGQDWEDGGNWRRLHQHTYTHEDDRIRDGWNFVFGGINDCNRIISQFEQLGTASLGAEEIEILIAELKVLRALYYYWAMDLYGNVPIVISFDVEPGFEPATEPRQQVYAFVEKEILDNMGQLSKNVDLSTYGRVNYYVAQTILAKLYLNAEVYTGTPQWEKANAACDTVINSGKYSLAAAYFDNFKTVNQTSPEFIFAIPYDQVFARGFGIPSFTLHYASRLTYNLTFQPNNGVCSLEEFYNLFEDGDVRKNSFIVGPQYTSAGDSLLDNGAEPTDPDGLHIHFTPEINALSPALRQAGARIGKWEYQLGATGNLSNDFAIFRYADVLMMKAEALWRQNAGDANALALVNQIRERAEVAPFTSLNADNLLAERGREFFSEVHRRQDLIRFDAYNGTWWEKPVSEPYRNIFPIPRAQLDANRNLSQNPGYAN